MGIIFGLISDNKWDVQFDSKTRKEKINKWINIRGQFIKPKEQASSSSEGKSLSQSLAGGAREGAKEVAKQVVKSAVAKAGELAIKKALGI